MITRNWKRDRWEKIKGYLDNPSRKIAIGHWLWDFREREGGREGVKSCILATRRRKRWNLGGFKANSIDTPPFFIFIIFSHALAKCVNDQSYYGLVHVKGHNDWPLFQKLGKYIKIVILIFFIITISCDLIIATKILFLIVSFKF